MIRAAGSHALHLLMEAVLGVAALIGLLGCAFVWRLSQGPIDITTLVQREQHRLPTGAAHVSIGHAELAWEGFHDPDSALDIRFADLLVTDAAGVQLARFPAGRVTLAVAPLVRGAVLPRTVVLQGPAVTLQRRADGGLQLDFGGSAAGAGDLEAGLKHPAEMPALAQLKLVRLKDASVTLQDAALGVAWRAGAPDIVLRRRGDGSVTGDTALDLAVGDVRTQMAAHVTLDAGGLAVVASLASPLSPAAMARILPVLRPLQDFDTPITAGLAAQFDPALVLRQATLSLRAGAGKLHAGQGEIALQSAAATLRTDGRTVSMQDVRVALAPPAGSGGGPVLTGRADLSRAAGVWRAEMSMAMDRVSFADLPSYWPRGVGGGAQPWITENITAGVARDVQVRATLEVGADGADARLIALSGGLEGHDLTVHWLRPVPPIEHAEAHLVIDGPDVLHVDLSRAAQGSIAVPAGSVRIRGLAGKDQFADITASLGGGLADILALLNHPRLRLLARQPLALSEPAGQVKATLKVNLPLEARVTFDDIGIDAKARLTDVHLTGLAAGHDLDGADLDLAVDTNRLTLDGTGRLGGVPARLGLRMDFRAGPATQVTTSVTAVGRASAGQLAAGWLPGGLVSDGEVGFDIAYALLRDATASVALKLDAGDAAVSTDFGWSKSAGQPASASATLRLLRDRLVGIDEMMASGPGLKLASHVETKAGHISQLVLDRLKLGRTEARGTIGFPGEGQPAWRVMLRGPALDLSAYLKQRDQADAKPADETDDESAGPAWQADLAFDQVVLARDETLAPVTLKAASDGLHFTRLALLAGGAAPPARAGGAAQPARVRASIAPEAGGRALSVDATDAGAVLLAAGVADNIRGGRLKLNGHFDDTAPHSPLSGSARLDQFRINDAPAIGRLLKAMTLYGAVDLLRGPGLGFAAAVVPFRWRQRVLHLENARAFSASLGLTAQGDIDLRRHSADVTGTIVPAYFFNQLLGKIPLLGKLFSPETGGGVFAARYSVRGPLKDPRVGVNPLSALTPGFLRGVFGLL